MQGSVSMHTLRLRVQNHDTGSTLNHWPFPWNHLHEGYAYILTHPGTPTIFCDHYFADGLGDSIRELVKIRKRAGVQCRSKARSQLIVARALNRCQNNRVSGTFAHVPWLALLMCGLQRIDMRTLQPPLSFPCCQRSHS